LRDQEWNYGQHHIGRQNAPNERHRQTNGKGSDSRICFASPLSVCVGSETFEELAGWETIPFRVDESIDECLGAQAERVSVFGECIHESAAGVHVVNDSTRDMAELTRRIFGSGEKCEC